MTSLYDVSAEAQNDLFEIWRRIADDSVDLANRIEVEFYELFASLGRMPRQ
jgi:plasmid stabilization system protein ParE